MGSYRSKEYDYDIEIVNDTANGDVNVQQEIIRKAGGVNRDEILEKMGKLKNAGEIMLYVRDLSNNLPGVFDEDIIQRVFKLYSLERATHANLKEDAIRQVQEYLNE